MAERILMPQGGQNSTGSLITRWHVEAGSEVRRGDLLFEIETDKATLEVQSFTNGVLNQICHGAGETVEAGEVVAYIGTAGELPAEREESVDEDEYRPISPVKRPVPTPAHAAMATPKARKMAEDGGKDISELYSELGRPVQAADIKMGAQSGCEDFEIIPASPMRKTIAKRTLESVGSAPQYHMTIKPVMDELVDLRGRINDILKREGITVSINDLLSAAVCIAAEKAPNVNASYDGGKIRIQKNVNIGIAVALPDGLVIPVIKGAEKMTIREIAAKSSEVVEKARTGRLAPSETAGGTITISNLGMYGIDSFTAILNRPESAILAVGAIVEMPVCRDGRVVVKKIADITASFDHSLIDGSVGALFLSEMKRVIENPVEILLRREFA